MYFDFNSVYSLLPHPHPRATFTPLLKPIYKIALEVS